MSRPPPKTQPKSLLFTQAARQQLPKCNERACDVAFVVSCYFFVTVFS
jgi:hypothetical protein